MTAKLLVTLGWKGVGKMGNREILEELFCQQVRELLLNGINDKKLRVIVGSKEIYLSADRLEVVVAP